MLANTNETGEGEEAPIALSRILKDGVAEEPIDVAIQMAGLIPPETLKADLDMHLTIQGMLDPRSQEFKDAVKLTPATLAHYRTKGKWVPAEHLLLISSILASEISQGDAHIIIEVPPRHGKSELTSVHLPTWFLEKFPWANVMLGTYAADLATGFGRRVRDAFVGDETGILTTRLREDVQRTDYFATTEGGGMFSVGIGGPLTGRGAHLLLIDDYIKNWAEASSQLVLDSIWNWFRSTAYTRLEPGGSCVILATRWTIDDLIGRLKADDPTKMWTIIRLPAYAEEGDLLNRQIGEALWPQRYPLAKLNQIERVIGIFMFRAMYQQDPKLIDDDAKADPDKIRYITHLEHPQLYRWCRSWDLAGSDKKKKKSDFTVGTLMGTNGRAGSPLADTVVAEQVRGRYSPSQLEDIMRATAERDGPSVPILIEQEPGSSGKIAAEHLANNVLKGFKVHIIPTGGVNKWIRAQPYMAAVTHGRMVFIGHKDGKWQKIHIKELQDFPNVKNDDTVDSIAQGFNYLHQTKLLTPTWGRALDAEKEGVKSLVIRPGTGKLLKGVVFGRRT